MARAAVVPGKVICFRCRREMELGRLSCPCAERASRPAPVSAVAAEARDRVTGAAVAAWLASAALAGSCLGAALALLSG